MNGTAFNVCVCIYYFFFITQLFSTVFVVLSKVCSVHIAKNIHSVATKRHQAVSVKTPQKGHYMESEEKRKKNNITNIITLNRNNKKEHTHD